MQAVLDEAAEYLGPDTERNVRELLLHDEAHKAADKVGIQARQIKSRLRRLAARHHFAQG
ncbi:hypothetical protein [Achromobacter ruhlandii]|uniref:hypothetical protein n=1 Tax=Achromobacter ruhlandii TaxID=72557 RepID=UPI003B9A98D4